MIEPHYLGSLEYFTLLLNHKEVIFEVQANFIKQTYKNRCYFLTSNGEILLTVPVNYGNRTTFKDVKIDYSQSWVREHLGAFYSAYGKAPYFDFFFEEFRAVWEKKEKFLLDLNIRFVTLCLKILQYDISFSFTDKYEKDAISTIYDAREQIVPKKSFKKRNLYLPFPYLQVFGSKFVPNLSIIDLIMCEGNRSFEVLRKSSAPVGEQL